MSEGKVSIQFLGAAGTVTGSKHLLKTPEKNILIDCGLFQGLKTLRLRNWDSLPVSVDTINLVILTHAHLDHCGYLPLLIKAGYKGQILMSAPTRDLVEIILRDSAKIQEEDADHANRHGYTKHKPAKPLYTLADVEQTIPHFVTHTDKEWITITDNIKFRFLKNGHILGSCFIDMQCYGKKFVFSGDIGREHSELLYPPTIIEEADYLIMESTYGDRLHPTTSIQNDLAAIINTTIQKNGNIVIPSFAVGRAQELMHIINALKKENHIPNIPVYMDSPMGADVLSIMERYPEWHKLSAKEYTAMCNDVTVVRDYHETDRIIQNKESKIIIAASGMITGGRVLEYLKHYVGNKKNTVVLVGYQAAGTRGRALQEGAHEIKLHGKYFMVNAYVRTISSLSGHGDQAEMINWLRQFKKKPEKIFLVHGEPMAQDIFRTKIKDEIHVEVEIPQQGEKTTLFTV